MPQISLYVDDDVMDMLRTAARGQGVSISKYVSGLIVGKAESGGWPEGYREEVYGSLHEDMRTDDGGIDLALDDSGNWFE